MSEVLTSKSFRAMIFAREVHAKQKRKYTFNPYTDHLAEVAGVVATLSYTHPDPDASIAVAWMHDSVEDQNVCMETLVEKFGYVVAQGVMFLSDLETGSRAQRKAASRTRLSDAPGWVQDIKVADLLSNTASIVEHDPDFAVAYLKEKELLLDVLKKANPALVGVAREQISTFINRDKAKHRRYECTTNSIS